jgi:hypothetical protein
VDLIVKVLFIGLVVFAMKACWFKGVPIRELFLLRIGVSVLPAFPAKLFIPSAIEVKNGVYEGVLAGELCLGVVNSVFLMVSALLLCIKLSCSKASSSSELTYGSSSSSCIGGSFVFIF